jgi:Ran GTPase-activating protein (RanGAP) involved in mRNA processing and transport
MGIESLVELLGNFGDNVNMRSLSLVLSGNTLGLDACVALASLLCDSPQVSSLSVANCGTGNAEMSVLSAAVGMQSCIGVTLLDLSSNNIGQDGAKSLASSLAKWASLKDLRLAGNDMLHDGVEALMNALDISNFALGSLDISQTGCGVQGSAAAVKCTKLTSLRLFNNKLGSDGFETLATLLKGGHATLVNLDLCGNDASEGSVVKLLDSIADSAGGFVSTLRVLEIGGNSGGNLVEEAIKRVRQVHPELDIARDKPRGEALMS